MANSRVSILPQHDEEERQHDTEVLSCAASNSALFIIGTFLMLPLLAALDPFFCWRVTIFLFTSRALQRTHILGGNQGYTPEIMDEHLTTARDLELEVNEDDIEELILGHADELTTEELQEILNEEHQGTHRNVSPE
ncbi:hypothetical protein TNCV_2735691 [Trichonephila clavipes]|nr:hypothetical protein TNCV_2735691 [Trichonephila clavipes]